MSLLLIKIEWKNGSTGGRLEAGACRGGAGVGRAAKRVRQRKRADAEAGTDSTEVGGKADTHTGNLEPGRREPKRGQRAVLEFWGVRVWAGEYRTCTSLR